MVVLMLLGFAAYCSSPMKSSFPFGLRFYGLSQAMLISFGSKAV